MKTTTLTAALALATTGYSAAQWSPVSSAATGANARFSLQQMYNDKFKGVNPTDALLRAYSRYATFVPDHIQALVDKEPSLKATFHALFSDDPAGSVHAEAAPPSDVDSEYVLPVSLGTPPQILPLNLDTGSSDFWVFSTATPQDELRGQKIYYPQNSTTSKTLPGEHWKIRYGDNSTANGDVYIDRAAIGPVGFDKQAIQVATAISSSIAEDGFFSGILGMASSYANTVKPTKQVTFLDNIKDTLDAPVFTANLQKGMSGNYNFGYIDASEHTGDIAYTPINTNSSFWEVELSGYQFGQDAFKNERVVGIVDTGTTLLLFPQHVVDEYYGKLPGSFFDKQSATMVFPCDLTPPDFFFGVGNDYRGRIPGHYMNYAHQSAKYCYGGLQSAKGIPFCIFGDILLKAQFVVFDRGNLSVGFANKKTVPAPQS